MKQKYHNTEWPDRIYIEEEKHQKYHNLLSKTDEGDVPFKTMKEIFMYSMILGYLSKEPLEISKRKELIFEKYLDSKMDKPLIQCLYLMKQGEDSCIGDKKGAVQMAEEYANAGFNDLYEAVNKGYDMLISLTEYLLENHIDIYKENSDLD